MINTIIVDDEHHNVDTLKQLLEQFCPEVNIVTTANNSQEAFEQINLVNPDLVFLDIEMPFGNAFDLLGKLNPIRFEVIFVTAFDQYAINAFEFAALDYLLKPVSIEKLKNSIAKARRRIHEKHINSRVEMLISNYRNSTSSLKKIGLQDADRVTFEDVNNILRLEAEGNYTFVYTKDKRKKIVTRTLKEFEDILPSDIFCRLHNSHIVNLNCIKKYYKGRGGYVEMEDGTTVEVSTRKKNEFLDRFNI